MADVELYTDGTAAATDLDIIKARAALVKNAWRDDVLKGGDYPLTLSHFQGGGGSKPLAEGAYNLTAPDDGQDGEFTIIFKYTDAVGDDVKAKVVMMAQLARQAGGRVGDTATNIDVYVTATSATRWADLMEATLEWLP